MFHVFFKVQFVITFIHSAQTYVTGCDFPLWGQYLLMGYMMIMMCLFGNFYFQAYINKNRTREQKKTDGTNGVKRNDNYTGKNGVHTANGHQNNDLKKRH